jgi:Sigma 54 modulation/S30EA ribosomal protein C terminus
VVVHRRQDENIGLLHPPDSPLAKEHAGDVVVPEPSRYFQPISLADARAEMDVLKHRFVYFIAVEDHGKVLYLRHDGDYGLVDAFAVDRWS